MAHPFGDDERSWTMPSNSGWENLSFSITKRATDKHVVGALVCAIRLRGDFWDRGEAISSAELFPGFDVTLDQVVIRREALETLHGRMVA